MLVVELEKEGSGGDHYSGCMTFVCVILLILSLNQSLAHFSLLDLSRYVSVVKADKRQQSRGSQTKGPGMFSDHFGQDVECHALIKAFPISELEIMFFLESL